MKAIVKKNVVLECLVGSVVEITDKQYELAKNYLEVEKKEVAKEEKQEEKQPKKNKK